jgi:predicted AAA+ superfamily ATPase
VDCPPSDRRPAACLAARAAQFPEGVILDEIQRVPELLSWIRVSVDETPAPGRIGQPLNNLFENLVVMECLKHFLNHGERTPMYFYRDSHGTEIDLVLERGAALSLIEIKSSQTIAQDFFRPLQRVGELLGERVGSVALIHGGPDAQQRTISGRPCRVLPWQRTGEVCAS